MSIHSDLYRALGKLVVEFNRLEDSIKIHIWSHLEIQNFDLLEILTSQQSFRQLVELLNSLFCHVESDPRLRKSLASILKEIDSLNEQRNIQVHSYWEFYRQKDEIKIVQSRSTLKRKVGLKSDAFFRQADEVDKITSKAIRLRKELSEFFTKYFTKDTDAPA